MSPLLQSVKHLFVLVDHDPVISNLAHCGPKHALEGTGEHDVDTALAVLYAVMELVPHILR